MSFVGRHISSLPTPALIVDKEKVIHVNFLFPSPSFTLDRMWSFLSQFEANCQKMLDLAETNKISLRAQTKTHKTVEGGVLQVWHHNQLSFLKIFGQTGGTRRKIVTSTLVETEMYADAGFEDILYGFPYIAAHQDRAWKLRERLEEFHLMVWGEMNKYCSNWMLMVYLFSSLTQRAVIFF